MHVVLAITSTNPDCNADCDYAVVELTKQLVEQLRSRAALAREALRGDNDLYELYFWGGVAEFYEDGHLSACADAAPSTERGVQVESVMPWQTDLDDHGHTRLPEGVDLAAHAPKRSECGQTILRRADMTPDPDFEVAWTAIPKHSDIYITTAAVPLKDLEAYAEGLPLANAAPQ